jgi:hypothetical protein
MTLEKYYHGDIPALLLVLIYKDDVKYESNAPFPQQLLASLIAS